MIFYFFWFKMCILLIGGSGFVGINFIINNYLKDLLIVVDPNEINVVGNYIHIKKTIQKFIEDKDFKKYDIDKIICLAADSFVPECGLIEYNNNIEIAESVLYLNNYYKKFGLMIPVLFFITDEIFDVENLLSMVGSHTKFNQSFYSKSKYISHLMLKDEQNITLAYPPNLFGNYQKHDCIIKKIMTNKFKYIEDSGEQMRYFMKVNDIVKSVFDWIELPTKTTEFNKNIFKNQWFKISINDLVEKVFKLNVSRVITRKDYQDKEYVLPYENNKTKIEDFDEIFEFITKEPKKRPHIKRTSNSLSF